MKDSALGPLLYAFFVDHLQTQRGLRPSSIKSYRDGFRILLHFLVEDTRRPITRLTIEDLTFERVLAFLAHLETKRGNHIRTRNQRLGMLHTFFKYAAGRDPRMLAAAQGVAAIPMKRTPPAQGWYLSHDEIRSILSSFNKERMGVELRDHALLLFLYNTGARVQETADLRVADIDFGPHPRVRLCGKGRKWRTCPIWTETGTELAGLLEQDGITDSTDSPVFRSHRGDALTRSGIYKIIRRRVGKLDDWKDRRISPHVFRHSTAVHLLEAGVDVNVIRAWLGHVRLETTNRYAEITISMKQDALRSCEAPVLLGSRTQAPWRTDPDLLRWLDSL